MSQTVIFSRDEFENLISGGKCLNVPNNKIRKTGANQWGTGGNILLEVDFSSLEAEMTRRAGVINDKSFFEIQMSASAASAGNVQLFAGKPIDPMSSLISVQNNKFEVHFVVNKSAQLSQTGKLI